VNGTLRCFVAIALPAAVRESVAAHFAREGRGIAGVRWTGAPGLHLTLKFLGGVEAGRLPAVFAAVDAAADAHAAFSLQLRGAGAFPSPERPRVVWVGAGAGAAEASALAGTLEGALAPLGFAPEARPFAPHLTVGRVKAPPRDRGALPRLIAAVRDRDWGEFLVPAAQVLRSELFPAGPIYSILHEARLRAAPDTAHEGVDT
jgi:2'-5' RNA ligase